MKQIRFITSAGSGVTVINNTFLDFFMPKANGEFVKIYLYLLRVLPLDAVLSISSIADIFEQTEKDVLRALTYWEKQELLLLERDAQGDIIGIAFQNPDNLSDTADSQFMEPDVLGSERVTQGRAMENRKPDSISPERAAQGRAMENSKPDSISPDRVTQGRAMENSKPDSISAEHVMQGKAAKKAQDGIGTDSCPDDAAAAADPAVPPSPRKAPLTADRIAELKNQEDIEQLLFIAAQYFGRPLTTSEISDILYYYDVLHFSSDLIEYLVEYCVSKGSKNRCYMEKVALGWASEGIQTVQEAKNNTSLYNKKYYSVLNAFGIKNRGPVPTEMDFIDRWTKSYGFSQAIIAEACNRTVAQTHQASFSYADKILSDWHKRGIHHLEEIAALDSSRARKKKNTAPNPGQGNRFNNFHQRDYDFDQLEKDLLNS